MKVSKVWIPSILLLLFATLHVSCLETFLPGKTRDILLPEPERQQQELESLRTEREELSGKESEAKNRVDSLAEANKNRLMELRGQLDQQPDNEFLKLQQTILTDVSEVLRERQDIAGAALAHLDERLKLFEAHLKGDPDWSKYRVENKLTHNRSHYSFQELRRVTSMIAKLDHLRDDLGRQERRAAAEVDSFKKTLAGLPEEEKKRLSEIKALSSIPVDGGAPRLSEDEVAELQRLIREYYQYKTQLYDAHIREREQLRETLLRKGILERGRYRVVKQYLIDIRPLVGVTDQELDEARKLSDERRVGRLAERDKLRQRRNEVVQEKDDHKKQLDALSTQHGLVLGADIDEWTKEPPRTVDGYRGICDVGSHNSKHQLFRAQEHLLGAQIHREDEQLIRIRVGMQLLESYRQVKQAQFATEEELEQEADKYKQQRGDAQQRRDERKRKRNEVDELLTRQRRALDNVKRLQSILIDEQEVTFRDNPDVYSACLTQLEEAERGMQERIQLLNNLVGTHSEISALIDDSINDFDFILGVLQSSSTLWHRSAGGLLLDAIWEAPNDIRTFLVHLSLFSPIYSLKRLALPLQEPFALFVMLLKLLFILALLYAVHRYSYLVAAQLERFAGKQTGALQIMAVLCSALIVFIRRNFWGIALYTSTLGVLLASKTDDGYLYIFFCLLLIPYALYLLRRLMGFLLIVNVKNGYIFLPEDYQRRFAYVMSAFLASTVSIELFRTAFKIAYFPESHLPDVLWALNFIIFQVSLIFLISKEQILSLIPSNPVRVFVDRYYYLLLTGLIIVIVMSHPYVGRGRLVWWIISRAVQTGLLISLLLWLHGIMKRASSRVFFIRSDDVVRERFSAAKTYYGLLIIVSFTLLMIIGLLIVAQIWGWQEINLDYMRGLFYTSFSGDPVKNPVSLYTLSRVIGIIFVGLLIAHSLNRFVFGRIYDLLLIDPGIQYTITTITQYVIVVAAVYIGLTHAGWQSAIYFSLVLIGAASWVLKEPASDFFAYFIILVQRPIKIGDYIKIDDEVKGVVRKITARAVVLRRKNSTTVVVSNSYLLNKYLVNWNHTRGFVACDDIGVVIDYREDPARAREVMQTAVEEHPNVLRNPKPVVRLESFSDSGYQFMIRAYISSVYTLEQWNIASDIRLNIVAKLAENNVKIALPVRMIVSPRDDNGEPGGGPGEA